MKKLDLQITQIKYRHSYIVRKTLRCASFMKKLDLQVTQIKKLFMADIAQRILDPGRALFPCMGTLLLHSLWVYT